ncbi:MAG: thioredoxin domain-containing protein, partial [Legionella sp.]|nr:thioredoxin domain-containing protein [Legionella sp.]
MTTRRILLALAAVALVMLTAWLASRDAPRATPGDPTAAQPASILLRPHSPVLGAAQAPVTVTEFFDPSCEACRAFHPFVKQLLVDFPGQVRVVVRYAPFHQGSDEAVAILEAAREQGRFEPVLEALLRAQPEWAVHGAPNLALAWQAAAQAGLDVAPAKRQAAIERAKQVLAVDVADLNAVGVEKTPTFFV